VAEDGFVVVVTRDEARWRVDRLPDGLRADLDALLAVLRQQPSTGGAIGLVDIADEFFVAVRVLPGGAAFVCAAVLSGFPLNELRFGGFLPRSPGARRQ